MTIHYSTLRNAAILVLLAMVCALVYLHFFRPQKPTIVEVPYPVPIPAPTPPPEFPRLSKFIDAHIDTIFSALDAQVPPIPHQELRMLREHFADRRAKESARAQPMYQTAIQLCDALLVAIQERERSSASLADTRSKAYSTKLSPDEKKEEEDKRKFFEFTILRRWADNSKPHRDKIVSLYSRLRTEEREFTSTNQNSQLSIPVGGMMTLQHPTDVRLRYGTATLPAGLSLRVLERTAAGVVVEYGGERVTLPPN